MYEQYYIGVDVLWPWPAGWLVLSSSILINTMNIVKSVEDRHDQGLQGGQADGDRGVAIRGLSARGPQPDRFEEPAAMRRDQRGGGRGADPAFHGDRACLFPSPEIDVHVIKTQGWYIKFYFVGDPDTLFISVHHVHKP
ncbi:hypothetical protein [Castellaniella denitrificans]|uniref:hypothetical protein n=1 Tax=Castellaniella denitrificans TaxID=56119 RepID=UPI001AD04D39|nr:hypothetical protein [Burkholderiales bacterium]